MKVKKEQKTSVQNKAWFKEFVMCHIQSMCTSSSSLQGSWLDISVIWDGHIARSSNEESESVLYVEIFHLLKLLCMLRYARLWLRFDMNVC